MRSLIGAVVLCVCVLLAPLRVAAQGMGWDGQPVQPVQPVQPAQGAPYGYGYAAPGYNINPQTMFIYEEEKKSPGLALVLSLLLPGLGNIYADHAIGAVVTWGLIIGGVLLINWGANQTNLDTGQDANGGAITIGFLAVLGGVIYSLVDSYSSAKDYNRELARRLGLPMMSLAPIRVNGSTETAWGPAVTLRF
jgi:TM2 domain-containing membrane protein YozV